MTQGSGLKIYFSADHTLKSYFSPDHNIINTGLIGTEENEFFTIFSVFAHETAHAFYNALVHKNYALPYDQFGEKELSNTLGIDIDNARELYNIPLSNISEFMSTVLNITTHNMPKTFKSIAALVKPFEDKHLSSIVPNTDSSPSQYFDFNHNLSIKLYPVYSLLLSNEIISHDIKTLEGGVKEIKFPSCHAVLLYSSFHNQCDIDLYGIEKKLSLDEINTWCFEVLLPQIVRDNNWTNQDVFIRGRVADAIARSGMDFDRPSMHEEKIFAEFAAHVMEFKALGFADSEMSQYLDIILVHEENCSPLVKAILPLDYDQCLNDQGVQVLCVEAA